MFRGEAVNMWVLNAFSLVGSISRMPVLRRLAVIALVCFLAMATAGCSIQRRL
jgi:hypothetical protein